MACTQTLTERLIEISSQPLHKYTETRHDTGYHAMDIGYEYSTHRYEWLISNRKRLVVNTSEPATLATNDQSVSSIGVQHRFGPFRWMEYINRSLIPESVVETIRQFALDGLKGYSARQDAEACEHALKTLS